MAFNINHKINEMMFDVAGSGHVLPKTGNIVIKDIFTALQQNNTEATDRIFKEHPTYHRANAGLYLGIAGSIGHTDVIKTMLDNGVDINVNAGLGLAKAAAFNFKETVDFILSHSKKDINRALHATAEKNNVEMFNHLVANGADIAHNNHEALKTAVQCKSDDIVKEIILAHRKDPDANTKEWLSEYGYTNVLKMIEKRDLNDRLQEKHQPKPVKKTKGLTLKI